MQFTYADQQQINTFNKLNQKYRELSAQVKAKKARMIIRHLSALWSLQVLLASDQPLPLQELLENLEDATNELVLVDEDKVSAAGKHSQHNCSRCHVSYEPLHQRCVS